MRITTGGEVLPEGSTVTILAPEAEDTFELGPDEQAELSAAIEAADRGDTVDDSRVRELLRRRQA